MASLVTGTELTMYSWQIQLQAQKNYIRTTKSLCIYSVVKTPQSLLHQEDIMTCLSVATFALMLVAIMAAPYLARKEETMKKDLVKTIINIWNEEIGKDYSGDVINRKAKKGHNKTVEWNDRDMDRGTKQSEKEDIDGDIEAGCKGRHCLSSADCCPANPRCRVRIGIWTSECQ